MASSTAGCVIAAGVTLALEPDLSVVDRARGVGQQHQLEIDPLGRPGTAIEHFAPEQAEKQSAARPAMTWRIVASQSLPGTE